MLGKQLRQAERSEPLHDRRAQNPENDRRQKINLLVQDDVINKIFRRSRQD